MSSSLIRWGALGALLGGVVFVVDSLLVLATPEAAWTSVVYIVAVLLVLVGLVGLHTLQKRNYGRVGRTSLWTVIVASLAQILGIVVSLSGSSALNWLVFPVGSLAVLVGFVLYGAATLQARVLPRWYGLGLIIIPPIAIASEPTGELLFGLLWLALGYMLWSRRGTAAHQPSSPVS